MINITKFKSSKLSSINKTIFEFFLFNLINSKIILVGIYRTKTIVLNLYKSLLLVDLRFIIALQWEHPKLKGYICDASQLWTPNLDILNADNLTQKSDILTLSFG